jgi:hypothetical protein
MLEMGRFEQVTDKKAAADAWDLVNRNQRLTLKAAAEQAKVQLAFIPFHPFSPLSQSGVANFLAFLTDLPPRFGPQMSLDESTTKFASLKVRIPHSTSPPQRSPNSLVTRGGNAHLERGELAPLLPPPSF